MIDRQGKVVELDVSSIQTSASVGEQQTFIIEGRIGTLPNIETGDNSKELLLEALQFYADHGHYFRSDEHFHLRDDGYVARKALEKVRS